MTPVAQPEAWLRGSIEGYEPLLLPAVHALIQAREDLETLAHTVLAEHVWARPGGAASVGFHIRHLGGALDRLYTYARDERLSDDQKVALKAEASPGEPPATLDALVDEVGVAVDRALAQLRRTTSEDLLVARAVGRAQLPATVLSLLFHGAEHSTRHAGQAITTAKILAGR